MFTDLTQSTMADPQYGGPLEEYTHFGQAGSPGGGAYMQVWLLVVDGETGGLGDGASKIQEGESGRGGEGEKLVIARAAYKSNGCPSSMAAGAMAARVLTGLTIEKALLLTAEDLLLILGGLPEGREECAHRAIAAVQDALR